MQSFYQLMRKEETKGASVTEFVLILPVIVALLYVNFTINEHLEDRQFMQIALRNAAALADADLPARVESLAKDIGLYSLMTKAGGSVAKQGDHAFSYGGYVFSLESANNKLSGADHDLMKTSFEGDTSNSYRNVSDILGNAASAGSGVLDFVKNLGQENPPFPLFIPDVPVKNVFTVSVAEDASLFYRALINISTLAFEGKSFDHIKVPTRGYVSRLFYRPVAGYHPEDYKYEGAVGFLLGMLPPRKHWGYPYEKKDGIQDRDKGFVAQCLMNFTANSNCTRDPPNLLAAGVRLTGMAKGIVQLILNLFSGRGAEGINQGAKIVSAELTEQAAEYIGKEVSDELQDKLGKKANEFAEKKLEEETNKVKQQASQSLMRALDDQTGTIGE